MIYCLNILPIQFDRLMQFPYNALIFGLVQFDRLWGIHSREELQLQIRYTHKSEA